MLDDLLGADRNGEGGSSSITDYNDPRICKYSLAGCCPYSLLQKTRLARSLCQYEICPAPQSLREAYQRDPTRPYDQMLYNVLDGILSQADRWIQQSKSRQFSKVSDFQQSPQLKEMTKKIKNLLEEARRCGMDGDVERARALLSSAEIVKEQMAQKEQELKEADPEQDSKVTVCEVCTAVIRQCDMDGRMEEHRQGRQHVAYLKMRDVFETLKSTGVVGSKTKPRRIHSSHTDVFVRRLEPLV